MLKPTPSSVVLCAAALMLPISPAYAVEGLAFPGMPSKEFSTVNGIRHQPEGDTTGCRTKQIHIQTKAARDAGRKSVLITGSNTRVYEPARKAFDEILTRDDLGPKL